MDNNSFLKVDLLHFTSAKLISNAYKGSIHDDSYVSRLKEKNKIKPAINFPDSFFCR